MKWVWIGEWVKKGGVGMVGGVDGGVGGCAGDWVSERREGCACF